MDFTAMLQQIDYAPVVASLTAVAAILVLPGVAKWGYNKIIGWFDPDAQLSFEEQIERDMQDLTPEEFEELYPREEQ